MALCFQVKRHGKSWLAAIRNISQQQSLSKQSILFDWESAYPSSALTKSTSLSFWPQTGMYRCTVNFVGVIILLCLESHYICVWVSFKLYSQSVWQYSCRSVLQSNSRGMRRQWCRTDIKCGYASVWFIFLRMRSKTWVALLVSICTWKRRSTATTPWISPADYVTVAK